MTEIVGIRFSPSGKIYYFSPNSLSLSLGDKVVVETAKGLEVGTVALANKELPDEKISAPLKSILRRVTNADKLILQQNQRKEERAFAVFEQKIVEHHLKMKLVDVSCTFDNTKLLFYFTAETRVDFRELVKELASIFRTRIELRQIGVRDEAKLFGGLGVCGREFCCRGYLTDFQPVTIKMAKEQNLSLNPVKISGTCGRLMCCLAHEEEAYSELQKITPPLGSIVRTPKGKGRVEEANLITGKLRIQPDNSEDVPYFIDRSEVEILRVGKQKFTKEEKSLKNLEN